MLKKIEQEKLIITQANSLASSAQRMTLQEKRLLLLLISYVRSTDDKFKIYYIPVSDIKDYLELSGESIYSKLQSICRKLMSQVLFTEDGDGGWEMSQWVSKSKYVPGKKSENGVAHLQMRLHEDLQPLLLNLKEQFGSIPFRQVVSMKSKYSIRLLEILYFSSHGLSIKILYFTIDDIKKRLGLKPINKSVEYFQEKYINFKDFKREVLEKAEKEFIDKSPIMFSYDLEKKGRKVIGLHFYLRDNPKQNIISLPRDIGEKKQPTKLQESSVEPFIQDKKLHDDLIHHGLKSTQITEFLNDPNIGLDGIIDGFEYFKKKLANDKIHSNKPAYLAQSIQKKWGEKTPEEKADEQKKKDIEDARATIKENKEILKSLEKDVSEYFDGKVSKIIESLDPDMKDALEAECVSQLDSFKRKMFKDSERFRNTQFKGYIRERFVKESEEDVLEKISRKRKVDIVEVEGKISEAQGVLKGYGVVNVNL